jgi:hypothetical protein
MSAPELPLVIIGKALQKVQECHSLGDRESIQPTGSFSHRFIPDVNFLRTVNLSKAHNP